MISAADFTEHVGWLKHTSRDGPCYKQSRWERVNRKPRLSGHNHHLPLGPGIEEIIWSRACVLQTNEATDPFLKSNYFNCINYIHRIMKEANNTESFQNIF